MNHRDDGISKRTCNHIINIFEDEKIQVTKSRKTVINYIKLLLVDS